VVAGRQVSALDLGRMRTWASSRLGTEGVLIVGPPGAVLSGARAGGY
jgi:hypothetical protein